MLKDFFFLDTSGKLHDRKRPIFRFSYCMDEVQDVGGFLSVFYGLCGRQKLLKRRTF